MTETKALAVIATDRRKLPSIIVATGPKAADATASFFSAHLQNDNTRRAYARVLIPFLKRLQQEGFETLSELKPYHVSAYLDRLSRRRPAQPGQGQGLSAPTRKQALAAIRTYLDYLSSNGVIEANAAKSVRGPKHSVRGGKTTVLSAEEARQLLDSIETHTLIGLRDRALVALMLYAFARVSAALKMNLGDIRVERHRLRVRLNEKGGKIGDMPCHHTLEACLRDYREALAQERATAVHEPLFRTFTAIPALRMTSERMQRHDAYRMVRRRVAASAS